jgi:putative addiction module component (TIGR02574 family)
MLAAAERTTDLRSERHPSVRSQQKRALSLTRPSCPEPADRRQFDMAAPLIDFSHLTADQRIELAEQLWNSLDAATVGPSDADGRLLRDRRAELARDDDPGEPWRQTIQELKKRGG